MAQLSSCEYIYLSLIPNIITTDMIYEGVHRVNYLQQGKIKINRAKMGNFELLPKSTIRLVFLFVCESNANYLGSTKH